MSFLNVKTVKKLPPAYKGAPRPAIAVGGRSNVGKSSLINTLVGRKVAPTSKSPGRTRGVHRYFINERVDLVDLPGYGFAKVSEELRRKWRGMVSDFLSDHGNLRCLLTLVDIRRGLGELDEELVRWGIDEGVRCVVVLTKADKLARGKRAQVEQQTRNALPDGIRVYTTSALRDTQSLRPLAKDMLAWWAEDAFDPNR